MKGKDKIIIGGVALLVLTATIIGGYKIYSEFDVVHAYKNISTLLKKFPTSFKV